MLIWGSRTRFKTLSEGIFHSPAAGGDAPYQLIEARRWFTFFFIPLFPTSVLGTFVRCGVTGAEYQPAILERPTDEVLREQLALGTREMVVAAAAAGGPATAVRQRLALDIIQRSVGQYDEVWLQGDLQNVPAPHLADRLRYLSTNISPDGAERLLSLAALMVNADGTPDPATAQSVRWMGSLLGLSAVHVEGVLAGAVAPAPRADSA